MAVYLGENLSLEIDNFRTLHWTFRLRASKNFSTALCCKLVNWEQDILAESAECTATFRRQNYFWYSLVCVWGNRVLLSTPINKSVSFMNFCLLRIGKSNMPASKSLCSICLFGARCSVRCNSSAPRTPDREMPHVPSSPDISTPWTPILVFPNSKIFHALISPRRWWTFFSPLGHKFQSLEAQPLHPQLTHSIAWSSFICAFGTLHIHVELKFVSFVWTQRRQHNYIFEVSITSLKSLRNMIEGANSSKHTFSYPVFFHFAISIASA